MNELYTALTYLIYVIIALLVLGGTIQILIVIAALLLGDRRK